MPEDDKEIPIPYEKPLILTEKQKWLCSHLDALNRIENFCPNTIPSDLFIGALFLVQSSNKKLNPDWMAQAAHSLREIMYGAGQVRQPRNKLVLAWQAFLGKSGNTQTRRERIKNLLKVYQEEQQAAELARILNDLHFIFTNIAHHFRDGQKYKDIKKKLTRLGISNPGPSLIVTDIVFEQLIDTLENVWAYSIPRQLTIHKQIDSLLSQDPESANKGFLNVLLSFNPDARQYFYSIADERWFGWLWGNGFLDVIKEKAEDPTRYGYRTSELNYLARISEKVPAKVVDIMLAVPISAENFNPEVVDRFLRICSGLPALELKRIVKKIRNERWVPLMGAFNEWGLEYKKMFQTLTEANNFDELFTLAEAVLSVRTKKEIEQTSRGFSSDNPFYFNDISYTKVFEYLLKVDEKNIEKALALVTDVMNQVVFSGGEEKEDEVFKIYDRFFLLEVDFFTLELDEDKRLSYRDDVKSLAAVIKQLAVRIIGKQCENSNFVSKLYSKYFKSLPDSRFMWRLRLFVLSLCPEIFKDELKNAFFRLFEVERYHEIISGAEYEKALRKGFSVLPETDKREYVARVITYFNKHTEDKKGQKWHRTYGSRILSMIVDQLTEKEKQQAEGLGFKLDSSYEPGPSIGPTQFGTVVSRGPITQEEFGNFPIAEIAKKLRNEWTPEKLSKQNKSDNFLNPLNAEGVGEQLRTDISKRLQDYVNNANLFFERGVLDQHYAYSFLRGIEETFRENKANVGDIDWDGLINLCVAIVQSGENEPFKGGARERDTFDAWLSGWDGIHSAIADVIQKLISEDNGKIVIDFPKYRNTLFAIIRYLLTYSDPTPEDEKIESAGMKTKSPGSEEYLVSDPYSMAINTVRGQAFQAFTLFIYQDGKKFPKEEKSKISSDVKELYETVLKKEQTRALMFMFGHYLPSFYFRDKEWVQGLLPQIFPMDPPRKYLYTAAWEGYLVTNLYEDIFFNPDIQKLYERGFVLTEADYPKQRHFKEPDEGIAVHIALAFMHFSGFKSEHDLFKKFWGTPNLKRHKEFISFIGRHSISRESAVEWIKYNKVDIEKLKKFWDWAIEHCNADELAGFGFWVNVEGGALNTKWLAQHARQTLEKTKGYIEWEYGLMRSLAAFAKEAPEDTLAILRAHLLEEVAKHEPVRTWLHMDSEVLDVFKELYKNEAAKEGVRTLINDLLPYRNGLFWGLKSILDEENSHEKDIL